MPITDDQGALFLILEALAHRGEAHYRGASQAKSIVPAVRRAAEAHGVLSAKEIAKYHETTSWIGMFPEDKVVQLTPPKPEGGQIALLWCRWDFHNTPHKCGFYYGVWYHFKPPHDPDKPAPSATPAFLGYRFETPERGTNHNYFHCQPCLNMGRRDAVIDRAINRSDSAPTWPIAATNSVELLLCLVLSLYGFQGLRELKNDVLQMRTGRRNAVLQNAIRHVEELAVRT